MKTFFSANNGYFVKITNIFSKEIFFFNLVLQQMNNHDCVRVHLKAVTGGVL